MTEKRTRCLSAAQATPNDSMSNAASRRCIEEMTSRKAAADRATIEHTDDANDYFDGVAYELSWWGRTRLGRREGRAYRPVAVTVEIDGKAREAFTYIPLPPPLPNQRPSTGSWIDLIVEGALENNMGMLLGELSSAGAEVTAVRGIPL